jgi:alkylation response protein AidB-like acyl-CoA dehydrogenase
MLLYGLDFVAMVPLGEESNGQLAEGNHTVVGDEGSELEELLSGIHVFLQREVIPKAAQYEADGVYPADIIRAAKALGLFGMAVPVQLGGLGLSPDKIVRVMEALAHGWTSFASFVNSHSTVAYIVGKYGTARQQQGVLPRMATGELHGSLLLTESHAGSDLQAIRTVARHEGDNYRIKGAKTYITNGSRSNLMLVLARTDPDATPPKRGISLLLVESDECAGIERAHPFDKMAFPCVETCEIRLDDVAVPRAALVGGVEGRGLSQLLDGLDLGRLAIAASAVGLGTAALESSIAFAKERHAFGVPISEHQAIRLLLAEMTTAVHAARALTRHAAEMKMKGAPGDWTGMAKLCASEMALEVTTKAVRIHGGSGYIRGVAAERFYREVMLYVVTEGTNEILKLGIARKLLAQTGADGR